MREIEKLHPFQVFVAKGLVSNDIDSIFVNAGKVYNFYNPANFRHVKIGLYGKKLPSLPMPTSKEELRILDVDPLVVTQPVPADTIRIIVYLVAALNPPLKWVPSYFYSPKVHEAWLIFRFYKQEEEQEVFDIVGDVKNPLPTNIRYEAFDSNIEIPEGYDVNSDFHIKFYEKEFNPLSNVFNLAVVAQLEKVGESWQTIQFIKNNFPISFLLNTKAYEACNTALYNQNVIGFVDTDEYNSLSASNDRKINNLLFSNRSAVFQNTNGSPDNIHYRGYIQYYAEDGYTVSSTVFQPRFPSVSSSIKESLHFRHPSFQSL